MSDQQEPGRPLESSVPSPPLEPLGNPLSYRCESPEEERQATIESPTHRAAFPDRRMARMATPAIRLRPL